MEFRAPLFLCLLMVCTVRSLIRIKTCPGRKADIIFMLDESRSIWYRHFFKQLRFVREVASAYNINPDVVRVGMVTWSSTAKKHWDLDTYSNKAMLLHRISRIRQAGGGRTYTHAALSLARHMFKSHPRPNTDKIVILMTDGVSSRKDLTAKEGALLLADGVQVFAIGVGHKVLMEEICQISTKIENEVEVHDYGDDYGDYTDPDYILEPEPEQRSCYSATNFADLNWKLRDELIESTCEIREVLTGECNATIEADVAFVLGSIHQNPGGAKSAVGFVRRVIASENLFLGPVQIALVPEDYVSLGFGFSTYKNRNETLEHLDYALTRFETTADLINIMQDRTFSEPSGHRQGVRKVAVVVLDRRSPNRVETIRAAQAAKRKGIEIVSVGIGDQFDRVEWSRMASNKKMKVEFPNYETMWKSPNETLWFHICP